MAGLDLDRCSYTYCRITLVALSDGRLAAFALACTSLWSIVIKDVIKPNRN
jgi:hypothetical protein